MEPSTAEHSDSDSGESWTLLDPTPSIGDTAPDFHDKIVRNDGDVTDKDEDTDGISIISDSEPECCHCQPIDPFNYEIIEEDPEPEQNMEEEQLIEAPSDDPDESLSCNDLLGNRSVKNKTYVHRRNKKLSTVLNLIVLFSVITAVGVAIGHMWGVRDDCTQHSLSNVNKILSKLYKLQEENVILRNKIRELTLANTFQFEYNKDDFENPPAFKRKFKKMFDDKYASTSMCYVTYVDESGNPVNNNRVDQSIVTSNADKLDENENKPKADYCILINDKRKRDNSVISSNERYKHFTKELDGNRFGDTSSPIADKLVDPMNKSEQIKDEKNSKLKIQFIDKTNFSLKKEYKKQHKLRNKNEAKGEKEDDVQYKKHEKNARIEKATVYKLDDYETDVPKRYINKPKQDKGDYGWYEKRAVHRMEARKKSFSDTKQDGSAGWYFRRMKKREQSRNKPVNLTDKKANKKDSKN